MKKFLPILSTNIKKITLKIELLINKLLRLFPNLKKGRQKKLAQHLWMVALALAILGVILVIFTTLDCLQLAKETLAVDSNLAGYLVKHNLWRLTTGLINGLMTIALGIIFVKSVKPLRDFDKKGWWYLFLICLTNIIKVTVSALLNFNLLYFVATVILGALLSLVGFYILKQTKSYFKPADKN